MTAYRQPHISLLKPVGELVPVVEAVVKRIMVDGYDLHCLVLRYTEHRIKPHDILTGKLSGPHAHVGTGVGSDEEVPIVTECKGLRSEDPAETVAAAL